MKTIIKKNLLLLILVFGCITNINAQASDALTETFCQGTGSRPYAVDMQSGTPGSTYAWSVTTASGNPVPTPLINGGNATNIDWTTTIAGTYTVKVLETNNSCSASERVLTIIITPKITPTFDQVAPVCSGATIAALPTTSTNGITGTWSPDINNLATTTYTFTPTDEICNNITTMTITVNPLTTPTFTQVAPVCSGATIAALPTTSTNGITGTWSP
ncbi:MAG: hypothetical protein ACOYK3_11115, partial [Flavobacterium sp.]